ncbi:hypothetical protein, partial [Streptomyces sp. NPDC048845]|uniref:hypothetical protein n=1 Tax=Streptomyces sp. NPDC048845 TaxID=3155390 RepID=UPI003414CCCF
MTVCEFRHEAGRAHDRLAARLETAMEGLPELVQDVTGLPLPTDPPLVVRLVTLRQWRRALHTHHDHLLRREVRRTRMTLLQVLRAARWQKKVRRYRLSRWIQVAAQTVGDRDGQPQVLAIADALHHTGTTDAGLIKLLGHELTHVAQHQAGGGFALDAANLRLLVVRHRPDGAVQDYWGLTEGHAMWSEEEITQRRLGRAVPFG